MKKKKKILILISFISLITITISSGLIIWKFQNKNNSDVEKEKESNIKPEPISLKPEKPQPPVSKEPEPEKPEPPTSKEPEPEKPKPTQPKPESPKTESKYDIEQKIENQLSKVNNIFNLETPHWTDKFANNYKKIINEQKSVFSSLINNASFLDADNNLQKIKWKIENIEEINEKISADLIFEFLFENELIIKKKKINIENILTLNKIKQKVNDPYFWTLLAKDSIKRVESIFQNYQNKNFILNQNNLYAPFGQGKVKTYYSKLNNPILLEYFNIPDNIIPLENNKFQIWVMFINNEQLNNALGFLEFEIRVREKINGDDQNFLETQDGNRVSDTNQYFSAFSEKTFITNNFSSYVKQNWESLISYLKNNFEQAKINYDKDGGLSVKELMNFQINERYKEFLKYLNNDKFNFWKSMHEDEKINYDVYITNIKENSDKTGLELKIKLKLPHISFSQWNNQKYQENSFIVFDDTFKVPYKK